MKLSILDIFKNANTLLNKKIILKGWVRYKRKTKIGILFISIYDGSSLNEIQVLIYNTLKNYYEKIKYITIGCSVCINGILVESIKNKKKYEIIAEKINVIGKINNTNTFPISNKKHSMEFLREISHLRIRTNLFSSISRIRHSIFYEIHNFMNNNNFIWIPTPIITSCDTEGSGKLFNVTTSNTKDFFGKKAFLTVSGQLNAESYACALSKVYTFGPVFRAENSNTRKHLSEFWMLEPEVAFFKLKNIIDLSESLIKYICKILLEKNKDEILFIYKRNNLNINFLEKLINNKFYQISYNEAINILNKNTNNVNWGSDLSSNDEKYLLKYFNFPVIIKNFPKNIKPFYMKLNSDETTVASMDILMPNVGEVIGGSEREEKYELLKNKMKNMLNKDYYNWYIDLRRYGTIPHSGFGLGFERLILSLTGINNIRDIVPFPRSQNNIKF